MGETQPAIEVESIGAWTRRVRLMCGDALILETSKDVVRALGSLDAYAENTALLEEHVARLEPTAVRDRALLLLGHRERTRAELDSRLEGEGFSPTSVREALDRLQEVGALSDVRYAEILARSKLAAGWSGSRVHSRLCKDGVSRELATETLAVLTSDSDEIERACALLKGLDLEGGKARNRAIGRLARRGYSPSQAYAAIDRVRSESS
jgi:SOS response regulatory protein OraA/RecX